MKQKEISSKNAAFWNELCGSQLARVLGITDHSIGSLNKFDQTYLDLYPYLMPLINCDLLRNEKVLEVGLGYGTVGQQIAASGAHYHGLDIAQGPVDMMNHRFKMTGVSDAKAVCGSMIECPFDSEHFDCVVSIGCFHHTGDTQKCVDETFRVLKPGGTAIVMVYNKFSYRQWIRWPHKTFRAFFSEYGFIKKDFGCVTRAQRRAYDKNSNGNAAPETDFFSIRELQQIFRKFSKVALYKKNCDAITCKGRHLVDRKKMLSLLGKRMGLDIYIKAIK